MAVATERSGIRPGYKLTEVGVIPDDWEVASLAEVCSMKSGEGITSARIDQFSEYRCYGGNGLRGFTAGFTHDGHYALIGRQGALCGNVLGVEGKFFASEHAIVVTSRAQTAIRWLTFVLGAMRLNRYSESSAQPGLSVSRLLSLNVARPPTKAEQEAIAEALSDADALIVSLDELIAKKRDLKTAAMQQLLTGKRRLPGFSGKWQVKPLGELLSYEQPTAYLVKSAEYNDSVGTPVLTAGKTFVLGYTVEETGIVSNLPTVIFDDFTTESKYVDFPFKAKSSAMKMLRSRSPCVSLRFIFERMQLIHFPLGGHKRYWISEYQNLPVVVPDVEEQNAIAAILSDMDAEIAALEARRDKARAMKQGMMQQLLTGSIRLV
jgi:type I restriction enzyme S subunit